MTEILTESFCERCGTRYTFESARPKTRLKGVKVLSRGLKNFVLSDTTSMDEAMAAARSETDREATAHQLDAFHRTFNFCMSCRQYTCPNCWNDVEARCLSCAPLALPEAPVVFEDLASLRLAVLIGEPTPGNGTVDHEHEAPPTAVSAEIDATIEPELMAASEAGVSDPAAAVESEPAEALATVGAPGEAEPLAEWTADIAGPEGEAPVAPPAEAPTPAAAFAPDVTVGPALTSDDAVDPAGKAADQTAGLLRRFRPGQSLDAELDAHERLPSDAETPGADLGAVEPAADVVEQPTWRITAPEAPGATPSGRPPAGHGAVPLQTGASPAPTAEPQWPARPEWPGSTPAAGLPFLGRPAAPQGGIDALWAASNQELVAAPPTPEPARPAASGVQPCVSCGLSLSASARFCRRCGTLQGR